MQQGDIEKSTWLDGFICASDKFIGSCKSFKSYNLEILKSDLHDPPQYLHGAVQISESKREIFQDLPGKVKVQIAKR